jgi:hypothetical protein
MESSECFQNPLGIQLEMSIEPLYSNEMPYLEMLGYLAGMGFTLASIEPGFGDPGIRQDAPDGRDFLPVRRLTESASGPPSPRGAIQPAATRTRAGRRQRVRGARDVSGWPVSARPNHSDRPPAARGIDFEASFDELALVFHRGVLAGVGLGGVFRDQPRQ